MPPDGHVGQRNHITLNDIAQRCGVSNVTVSRALRGISSRVSQRKAEEIRAVAAELGYDLGTNHAARQLALQKHGQRILNRLIALFMPLTFFDTSYHLTIYRGIIEGLLDERFGLLTNHNDGHFDAELLPLFSRGEVDGALVLATANLFKPALEQLQAASGFAGRPIVSMIDSHVGCSAVVADDRQGGELAVGHLLALGHRRILHFHRDAENLPLIHRVLGYRLACEAMNLDPGSVLAVAPKWEYIDKRMAVHFLHDVLLAHPDITAILAPNDMGAQWIIEYLQQQGRRVPNDISVVGFDDTDPLLNHVGENILTTIRLPLRDVGREAARLVVQQIREQATMRRTIVLPCELMVRGTTTAVRHRV